MGECLQTQTLRGWADGQMDRLTGGHAEVHSETETVKDFMYFEGFLNLLSARYKGFDKKQHYDTISNYCKRVLPPIWPISLRAKTPTVSAKFEVHSFFCGLEYIFNRYYTNGQSDIRTCLNQVGI